LISSFEVLTTFLNDGGKLPVRSAVNNAHAYLGAPYGIYETSDGYLALAMGSVERLGKLLECAPLLAFDRPEELFTRRDEIKQILAGHLRTGTTRKWLAVLEPNDVWCADVLTWPELFRHDAFKTLDMVQQVLRGTNIQMLTTRCPIRVDGSTLKSPRGAPRLGEDTEKIRGEFMIPPSS
jgi:crotonobetainyl-CoA:carnitine CoA-transferase CaiB-like acyl-CoA transferase